MVADLTGLPDPHLRRAVHPTRPRRRALAGPIRQTTLVLRNLPAAASVAWRHLTWDRVHSQALALRAMPAPVRALAVRTGSSRLLAATLLAPLGLAAQGRRADAVRWLAGAESSAGDTAVGPPADRPAPDPSPARAQQRTRRLRRRVAAACALDDAPLAARLLADLPSTDPAHPRLTALVAVRRGDLLGAERAARRAAASRAAGRGAARRGVRLARRIAAEVATLSPPADLPGPAPARPGTRPTATTDVLHLVTNALPYVQAGYTVRTQGIARAQRRAGQDAQVATRLGFPVTAGVLAAAARGEVDGVPHHRLLPAGPLPVLADAHLRADVAATDALVHRLRPRVLHAHSKHLNAQVALAVGHRHGLPVVYEVRGFLEETWRSRGGDARSDQYRLNRDAETWCMRRADAVVTLSESMRQDLLGRGLASGRVHVVPNAVDDTYLAEPAEPGPVRARLGIAPDALVVAVISTLNDYEGVDVLIDAVALLRKAATSAHLLVVGDGPARHALATRAGAAGLSGQATFTGQVPRDLARGCHLAADIFCVPRLDTPVTRLVPPLKPLEAMASGRPVVASDLPPLRETISDGVTGRLVPPGDPAALAATLGRLLADDADRHRMGRAAREWVLGHRTWAQAASRYGDLYAGLADPSQLATGRPRNS
jgi:glycosyltransferase involved in cell wall biosynthesis